MICTSLGKVVSGTLAPPAGGPTTACRILFRAIKASTGIVHVGKAGFTPLGAGEIGEVQITSTSGFSDYVEIVGDGGNVLNVTDYAVSPAVGGEGVYVSYWTR